MAKRKSVKVSNENHSHSSENIQSIANGEHQEASEGISVGRETPEFRRELADFIKVIGYIRSAQLRTHSQTLDNDRS